MAESPTQRRGRLAEEQARDRLVAAGLVWVASNVRAKVGEIDLIMRDGETLVFVEVRSRRGAAFGGAAGSVDAGKQRRLRLAAQWYLQRSCGHGAWPPCRFDVVAFEGEACEWIRDAF